MTAAEARRGDGTVLNLSSPRDAIAAGFGFCPEDRKTDGVIADLTVRENIALALQARIGWMRRIPDREQRVMANDYIRKLDIRTPDAEKAGGAAVGRKPAEGHAGRAGW